MNKPLPPVPPLPGRAPVPPGVPKLPGNPAQPGLPGGSSISGPSSSKQLRRPPIAHFLVGACLLVIEAWLMIRSSKVDSGAHLLGALLGMFVSIILLGIFRQSLNSRRASGSFSEWAGPIESTKAMWIIILVSWGLGTWHLWLAMYEILRPA